MAKEQSQCLRLNLQITDENYEMTGLESYLKNELDTFVSNSNNTILWHDAKEQLGTKLVKRDKELLTYKTKYYYSTALNVGLVGYVFYRLFSQST